MTDVILSVQHLSKSFPGVKVLNDINIDFRKGTVHAIVGENGAGKSTFMNIVFGVYTDFNGKMILDGKETKFASPMEAQHSGIAMVHQENSLIPYLSVMDNIFLGHYPKKGFFIDKSTLRKKTDVLLGELNIKEITPDSIVDRLSVAQRQLVEIVKALSLDARLLMLDEPTASLTITESQHLMRVISQLREKGVAIVYVSHKLDEVFEIADEISVLRDGEMIRHLDKAEFDHDQVVYYMIGRKLQEYDSSEKGSGDFTARKEIIRVEHLSRRNELHDISFSAKEGEILGFGGLVGAGRSELMEAIFGFDRYSSGEIFIGSKKVEITNPVHAIENGIALVPEERKQKGIFARLSIMENINVVSYKNLKNGRLISSRKERDSAEKYVEDLRIRTTSIMKMLGQLSGGNQQKVILARWLRLSPKILILDEPTHGIDIGAKEEIYKIIRQLASEGTTILLVSSEMDELIRLSDRVVVMREGYLKGILERDELSQTNIMKLAI